MLCLLDMDGVLADFVAGVVAAHKLPDPYESPSSHGIFEMETLWKMTASQFWKPLDYPGFWLNLAKTPEADGIVELAGYRFGIDNVCILTAPSESHYCVPEKKEWISRYYPELRSQMLFGSAKKFLAGPNRYLVDDRDKNIESFNKAGGTGVLVPRLWNNRWKYRNRVMEVLDSELR